MRRVYLDHAATTAMRPEVVDAMLPFFRDAFGNPSSTHWWGRAARNALEEARDRAAQALGAHRSEIVFTSGGTEADNMAVLGRWRWVCRNDRARPIVCTAIEHKAVGAAAGLATEEGAELIVLGVDDSGRVSIDAIAEALTAEPCVVSVMWGNNEVGTLQPVPEIARLCRDAGVTFHSDAVQAVGKVPVRVDETDVDMLSISGHKLGGPKGIGLLYKREGVDILPLAVGGGQEHELRPGTENVASAVGLATALELSVSELGTESARIAGLRDRLEAGLRELVPDLVINGADARRLPHVCNVSIAGADAASLLIGLDLEGIAASGASACSSASSKPSHVLSAMGHAESGAAIRFSLSHTSTEDDVDHVLSVLPRVLEMARVSASAES